MEMEVSTKKSANWPQGVILKKQKSTQLSISANEKRSKSKCRDFKGVSWQKSSSKFMAYITLDKLRSLGQFKLASDAAFVSDKANVAFRGKVHNFATLEKFHIARKQEMMKEGLSVNEVGAVEMLMLKSEAKIASIRKEISS